MTTHAFGRGSHVEVRVWHGLSAHWAWLAGGYVIAFAVPFLLADVLDINRDLFYGIYALSVVGLFALWTRSTGYDLVAAAKQRWIAALVLGVGAAVLLTVMVLRTEDATLDPVGSTSSVQLRGGGSCTGSRRVSLVRLPDPRRLRGVCRHSAQPSLCGQGRDRHRRSHRFTGDDSRLPLRV